MHPLVIVLVLLHEYLFSYGLILVGKKKDVDDMTKTFGQQN